MATTPYFMHRNLKRIKVLETTTAAATVAASAFDVLWDRTMGNYDWTASSTYEALHLESISHIYQTTTMWFVNAAALRSSQVFPHLIWIGQVLYRRDLEEAGADNGTTIIRTTSTDIPYVRLGTLA